LAAEALDDLRFWVETDPRKATRILTKRIFPQAKTRFRLIRLNSECRSVGYHRLKHREPVMRVLIVYGSTQGQTHKIAEFVADRWRGRGHEVAVFDAARIALAVDPLRYDATLVAASLHAGGYQRAVARFAKEHAVALSSGPSAFLSVSLSAAGNDASDRAGLALCDEEFFFKAGWRPAHVHHAAGALAYSRYNFLLRWFMTRIARRRGASTDTSRDCEFTDYGALCRFLDGFLASVRQPTTGAVRQGWAEARWAV
jgi:menaquinone-dependent protoporphyrinogen oxidase